MPQTRRIDVRVPVDLAGWVDGYARRRNVSRSAVVCWALREAMALAAAGVPEIGPGLEGTADGRSAGVGRVRGAGTRASSSPGAPVASRPAAGAPADLRDVVTGPPRPRPAVPLVNVVAARKRFPRSLARRDVVTGLVRVGGVVCRDVDAVVDPGEVEC